MQNSICQCFLIIIVVSILSVKDNLIQFNSIVKSQSFNRGRGSARQSRSDSFMTETFGHTETRLGRIKITKLCHRPNAGGLGRFLLSLFTQDHDLCSAWVFLLSARHSSAHSSIIKSMKRSFRLFFAAVNTQRV